MRETVALIPARAGSKGVPGKNRRMIGGKPLIAYTIESARESRLVDRVVVSSDDPEVLEIAERMGVQAVARPPSLAQDDSPVFDAIEHALQQTGATEIRSLVLLQPTSPLRTPADIDAAVSLHREQGIPVCSVYRVDDAHPARMYRIDDGQLVPFDPDLAAVRRQDLPPAYHRNGALYVIGPPEIARRVVITAPMLPYVMSQKSSVNIDSEMDFAVLEIVLRGGV